MAFIIQFGKVQWFTFPEYMQHTFPITHVPAMSERHAKMSSAGI